MILVPLILGISDAAAAETFSPPHLIYADMPQILESYHSADMVQSVVVGILTESS